MVDDTRRGRGCAKDDDGSIELHVDCEGPTLSRMPWSAVLDTTSWVDANGEVLERRVHRNGISGGWRFMVRFRRVDRGKPVELRSYLNRDKEVLSETWSHILPAD